MLLELALSLLLHPFKRNVERERERGKTSIEAERLWIYTRALTEVIFEFLDGAITGDLYFLLFGQHLFLFAYVSKCSSNWSQRLHMASIALGG